MDTFITALYALGENCEYGALHDDLFRNKIVVGLKDSSLWERMQVNKHLTLAKAISMARQFEEVKQQQNHLTWQASANKTAMDIFFSLRLFPFQGLLKRITVFHFNLFFVSSTTCMSSFTASIYLIFILPLHRLPGSSISSKQKSLSHQGFSKQNTRVRHVSNLVKYQYIQWCIAQLRMRNVIYIKKEEKRSRNKVTCKLDTI